MPEQSGTRGRWADVTTGQLVLVGALALALVFGGWRALRDGRFRGTHALPDPTDSAAASVAVEGAPEPDSLRAVLADVDVALGERATLLQFSSAFCAPCRVTRRVLADVAAAVPGVAHVEIDAEQHLALVRELGVLRTPTTLVLDAAGREVRRASGAPRKEAVLAALGEAVS